MADTTSASSSQMMHGLSLDPDATQTENLTSLSHSGKVAFFDFDHTLITHESLILFLKMITGSWGFYKACCVAALKSFPAYLPGSTLDRRTIFKDSLLQQCLKNVPMEKAELAADFMEPELTWNDELLKDLNTHIGNGDLVIIATGALDIYIHKILHDVPHHGVLCTELEVQDQHFTGVMKGSGNCVRETKKQRVQEYLDSFGPFTEIYGYGNAPSDLPMMSICHHKKIV